MAMIRRAEAERTARDAVGLDLGDMARRADAIREEAIRCAESILAQARVERAALMAGAEERAREEGYAKGFAEGLEKGREAGRAEAIAQWDERLQSLAASWNAVAESIESAREASLERGASDLLALGVAFAARVARRAVELDPDPVGSQLRGVLERAVAGSVIGVRLNPRDHDTSSAALGAVIEQFSSGSAIRILADESVRSGSCRLDLQGGGTIDADLELQLDRLVRALMPDVQGEPRVRVRDEPSERAA